MASGFWTKVEPGTLNKRVTFCKPSEMTDDLGKTYNGMEEVITLWADFYPIRGQEFYEVQKIEGKVTHKCYCRYNTALADADMNWCIKYKGKKYQITSVIDGGYAKRYLEIYCTEYVNEDDIPDYEESDDAWME